MELDKIDKKILNVLLENSRLSYRRIAKKANVSVVTVMNRIKKLEKEDVIKSYTISLDYEKAGYDFPVIIELRIALDKRDIGKEAITQNPNILSVYDVTGQYDQIVCARFKSRKQLEEYLKNLAEQKYIFRTDTRVILKTRKDEPIRLT